MIMKKSKSILIIFCIALLLTFAVTAISLLSHPAVVTKISLDQSTPMLDQVHLEALNSELNEQYEVVMTAGDPQVYISSLPERIHSVHVQLRNALPVGVQCQLYYVPEGGYVYEPASIIIVSGPDTKDLYYELPENAKYDLLRLDIDADYQIADMQYSQEPVRYERESFFSSVFAGHEPFPWEQTLLTFGIMLLEILAVFLCKKKIIALADRIRKGFTLRGVLTWIVTWAFVTGCAAAVMWILREVKILDPSSKVLQAYILLFGSMIGCLVASRKHLLNHVELAFFIVGLHVGLAFVFLIPPTMYLSWDDETHFMRALKLSYGGGKEFYTPGEIAEIYRTVVGSMNGGSAVYVETKLTELHQLGSQTVYNGFLHGTLIPCYLPSAGGLWLGRVLNLSLPNILRLGRIGSLLCYLTVMAMAIRQAKRGKIFLSLIALLPTILFVAANFSYDTWCIAFIALGTVRIINIWLDRELVVDRKYMILTLLFMTLACMTKQFYIAFYLLCLFIPADRFRNKKNHRRYILVVLLIMLLVVGLYLLPFLSGGNGVTLEDSRGGDTGAVEQIKFILSNPFGYLSLLFRSVFENYLNPAHIMEQGMFFFAHVSQRGFGFPMALGTAYLVLMALSIFVHSDESSGVNLKKLVLFRIVGAIALFGTVCIMATGMYLTFTPIGAGSIDGFQERYLLPVLVAVPILFFPGINIRRKERNVISIAIIYVGAALLMCGLLPIVCGYVG